MNARAKGSCLTALGVVAALAVAGGPARAAEHPLLVVVEASPAMEADAGEIRRAIGSELGARTVAPMGTSADPPERALIVALDRERIDMSLRTNDAAPIARSIPAPAEPGARLRAIAWLAGNLARDQVTPILAETAAAASPLATMPVLASPGSEPVASPPPPAATEPPPLAETPVIVNRPPSNSSGPSRWSIAISGGPMTNAPLCLEGWHTAFCRPLADGVLGSAWRVEVQRHPTRDGLFQGAALEGTSGDKAPQLVGAMVFLGSAKHLGRWQLESVLGVGLDATEVVVTEETSTQSSTSGSSVTLTYANQIRPALCADGSLGISHPVSESVDLGLRLALHTTTVGINYWFLTTTLGVRYNFQ